MNVRKIENEQNLCALMVNDENNNNNTTNIKTQNEKDCNLKPAKRLNR